MSFSNPWSLLLLPALLVVAWIYRAAEPAGSRNERLPIGRGLAGWLRRWRIAPALAVRLLILLCLILALAGLKLRTQWSEREWVTSVFLLDRSDSISPADQAAQLLYLNLALEKMGPDDQAAVIVFGRNALIERSIAPKPAYLQPIWNVASRPDPSQSNLAAAIQLGLALYPPNGARRMVLLSDGQQTLGDAVSAAALAGADNRAGGVEFLVPMQAAGATAAETPPETLITNLKAPPSLRQGDRFALDIEIESTYTGSAILQIFSAGKLLQSSQVELQVGSQNFQLLLSASESGLVEYRAVLTPAQDTFSQNNEGFAYTNVSGPAAILLAAPAIGEDLGAKAGLRGDEAGRLYQALTAAGLNVQQVLPAQIPAELPVLAEYAAVVLVDVPARQLSNAQMNGLQSYVRDLGGGLVVIGGPTSFGVGGYFRTPLEEILPVEMQIKDELRRPQLGLVFIIDHSGSMADTSGGPTKVDLAKEAVIRSLDLLMPGDRVGVVAFDDTAAWVVEMAELGDPAAVKSKVAGIRADGGTDIMAGLQAMARVLPDDPAVTKHVILLTDGGADPTGIPELVTRLYQDYGITLSTIGVGRDAATFLPLLAELGGGRYHFAANPSSIPTIYAEETSLATRAYIVEETFTPAVLSPASPLLENLAGFPTLLGYVATTARPEAEVILQTHQSDPLLAAWQYGLGHAVAFTSDATGRWAQNWTDWPGYDTFWIQTVRSVIGAPLAGGLNAAVTLEGGSALLTVDVSESISGTLSAQILAPDGAAQPAALEKIAPGRYQGRFQTTSPGVYLIQVQSASGQHGIYGYVLSYSPEYNQSQRDPNALLRLAAAAGGQIGDLPPELVFASARQKPLSERLFGDSESMIPVWPWLLAIAVCLLPLDIALRRLVLPRPAVWLASVRQALSQTRSAIQARNSVAEQRPLARIERLKRAKTTSPPSQVVPTAKAPESPYPAHPQATPPKAQPSEMPPPASTPLQTPPSAATDPDKPSENSTASTLLAGKRRRQK